jgi:hypothetical protein
MMRYRCRGLAVGNAVRWWNKKDNIFSTDRVDFWASPPFSSTPGVPMSQYMSDMAEIGRLVNQEKATPIVRYCNGLFCGKSKRLNAELVEAGYTNVRRYQLGMPVWRALGGLTEIEPEGLHYPRGRAHGRVHRRPCPRGVRYADPPDGPRCLNRDHTVS